MKTHLTIEKCAGRFSMQVAGNGRYGGAATLEKVERRPQAFAVR